MAKRAGPPVRTPATASSIENAAPPRGTVRVDRLVEIIDQCVAAKLVADKLGEKLLAYLLAMAIQEARSSLQPKR